MCNVCCANAAISATTEGSWFQAVWTETKPPRRRRRRIQLVNRVDAPPRRAQPMTLSDLITGTKPYLLIQAEGEEEGPGRVRYGFDGETWTDWEDTNDVASEMLSTDVSWWYVPADVQAAVQSRSLNDLTFLRLMQVLRSLQFNIGVAITAGLTIPPGRAGVRTALQEMRTRIDTELDGLDVLDAGKPLLHALRAWAPRQPYPRSGAGLCTALWRHLHTTSEESPEVDALRRGLQYGLSRTRALFNVSRRLPKRKRVSPDVTGAAAP